MSAEQRVSDEQIDAIRHMVPQDQVPTKSFSECIANAHLVAAAPELLDALKEAYEAFKGRSVKGYSRHRDRAVLGVMLAAIAKAEGKA